MTIKNTNTPPANSAILVNADNNFCAVWLV